MPEVDEHVGVSNRSRGTPVVARPLEVARTLVNGVPGRTQRFITTGEAAAGGQEPTKLLLRTRLCPQHTPLHTPQQRRSRFIPERQQGLPARLLLTVCSTPRRLQIIHRGFTRGPLCSPSCPWQVLRSCWRRSTARGTPRGRLMHNSLVLVNPVAILGYKPSPSSLAAVLGAERLEAGTGSDLEAPR